MNAVCIKVMHGIIMFAPFGVFSKIRERRRARTLVPEPDITHTPEERDNDKVVL